MNLPTLPTQAPSRASFGARGSLARSVLARVFSDSGDSAAPATSGIRPERSAMPPSAVTTPGRSAPAVPKRTSFNRCSSVSGGRQAGGPDRFELFVGEDEFLMAERLGLRELAARELLHQVVDLAANLVEIGAVQDAARVHVHV